MKKLFKIIKNIKSNDSIICPFCKNGELNIEDEFKEPIWLSHNCKHKPYISGLNNKIRISFESNNYSFRYVFGNPNQLKILNIIINELPFDIKINKVYEGDYIDFDLSDDIEHQTKVILTYL